MYRTTHFILHSKHMKDRLRSWSQATKTLKFFKKLILRNICDSVMCFAVRLLLARDWRLQNLLTNAGQVSRRLSDVKFMQTHKHNHADFAPICLLPCEWKPDT